MKITVLNGSPKGMTSVTMQYVLFLQKKCPDHEFIVLNVCQDIKRLEDDQGAFQEVMDSVAASDAVIWAFPLYYLLVHASYKRFIELVFARTAGAVFHSKYVGLLSTSIHFFDHTAHEYLNGICDDLGMRCVGSYSAGMYDLLKEPEQNRLLLFFDGLVRGVREKTVMPRRNQPLMPNRFVYEPALPLKKIDTKGKSVVIVSDADNPQSNAAKMVAQLQAVFQDASIVNLHEIRIRGGCLGCCQCGLDNTCVYKDADEVYEVYEKLMAADVQILAGTIQDRYLSSRWKLFFDRGFFHNHVPIFSGKQMGYVIAGPLMQLPNLRQILEGYAECQQANVVGTVTDEGGDSRELDQILEGFARRLIDCAAKGYIGPPTFLSVAGRKLFRDEIWGGLRIAFPMDHRYYKRHGLYDFPRKSLKTRLTEGVLALLMKLPRFRQAFKKRIKQEMLKPLQRMLENV